MALDTSARALQEFAAHLSPEEKRRGYPAQFKAQALAYFEEQSRLGFSEQQIARQLGICQPTLNRWLLQNSPSSFSFVALAPSPSPASPLPPVSSSGFTVSGPYGLRIEGLQLGELVELFRGLSC
jgi:hypothetical protein